MSYRPLLALFLLTLGACTYRGLSSAPPPPFAGDDAPPTSYYDAGGAVPTAVERRVEATRPEWVLERVLVPARVPEDVAHIPHAADPIELLHYRPRTTAGHKQPLILMSPILENSTILVDYFCESFARAGYHAVIVPRKELAEDPETALQTAEAETRLVVMRSRQALDWLLTHPDVDPERLGTFGISAGSIVSAMLAGADPRLRTHVWALAGGPLADVMMDTSEGGFADYGRETEAVSGLSKVEIRERLRTTLLTDPVRMAPRVGRDRVLLVLARYDDSVPYRHGLTLWNALGQPERIVLPTGHRTALLFLPYIDQLAHSFFRRKMAHTRPCDASSPGIR